jgi:hypothetical protein
VQLGIGTWTKLQYLKQQDVTHPKEISLLCAHSVAYLRPSCHSGDWEDIYINRHRDRHFNVTFSTFRNPRIPVNLKLVL